MITTEHDAQTVQLHEAHRRRRRLRLAGLSMIVASIALAIAETLHPQVSGDGPGALASSMAATPRIWTLWAGLVMATALLQLPAIVAWRSQVITGPGSRWVGFGGGLTALAAVCLFAFGQLHLQAVAFAGSPPPVAPSVVAGFVRAEGSVAIGISVATALVGFHLGWALLLIGLARARLIPVPLAIVGAAAATGSFAADALGRVAEVTTFVVLAGALAAVGLRLINHTHSAPVRPR